MPPSDPTRTNSMYPTLVYEMAYIVADHLRTSFIRVESLDIRDPAQPQYPALAFSSKFTYVFLEFYTRTRTQP